VWLKDAPLTCAGRRRGGRAGRCWGRWRRAGRRLAAKRAHVYHAHAGVGYVAGSARPAVLEVRRGGLEARLCGPVRRQLVIAQEVVVLVLVAGKGAVVAPQGLVGGVLPGPVRIVVHVAHNLGHGVACRQPGQREQVEHGASRQNGAVAARCRCALRMLAISTSSCWPALIADAPDTQAACSPTVGEGEGSC
jgi:hypothetical protein